MQVWSYSSYTHHTTKYSYVCVGFPLSTFMWVDFLIFDHLSGISDVQIQQKKKKHSVHSYWMIRSMLCFGLWAWAGTKIESHKKVWAWSTAGCQPAVSSASTSCISFLKFQHICPDCHNWKSFFFFSPWIKLLEWLFSCYSVPK